MVLYIEDPKDATRKLLELISEFGKVACYKINTRNLLHFYTLTNNKRSEREIQEAIPFTIASERITYLGINLPKETGGADGKASAYNARDSGLIPGLGRSPGEGNGNPL